MYTKKFNHGRIKPKKAHKNSGKAKGYKDENYLSYMHNSNKRCLVCNSDVIELHHLRFNSIVGRDDKYIVPLCPEHHRGSFCSPHGSPARFYDTISKKELMQKAIHGQLLLINQ